MILRKNPTKLRKSYQRDGLGRHLALVLKTTKYTTLDIGKGEKRKKGCMCEYVDVANC